MKENLKIANSKAQVTETPEFNETFHHGRAFIK
jgi:hypothetical protein